MVKAKAVLLDNWSSTGWDVPPSSAPPEQIELRLQGSVASRPRLGKKANVLTSPIREVDGLYVATHNTTYLLGIIDPDYRQWLRENRPNWDAANPITIDINVLAHLIVGQATGGGKPEAPEPDQPRTKIGNNEEDRRFC